MLYLFWLFSFVICAVLYVGVKTLIRLKKKERLFSKDDLKPYLVNLGSMALLSFVFCLILFFFAGGWHSVNISLFFVAIDVIVILINPWKTYADFKSRLVFEKKHLVFSSLLVVILALETFAFNYHTYSKNGDVSEVSLISTNANITDKNQGVTFSDEGMVLEKFKTGYQSTDPYFVVGSVPSYVKNMRFSFAGDMPDTEIAITVYVAYDNNDYYTYQGRYVTNGKNENFNIVKIDNGSIVKKVKLSFSYDDTRMDAPTNITLTKMEFDSPFSFVFSPIRFIFLCSIAAFIVYLSDIIRKITFKDSGRKPYLIIGAMGVAAAAAFVIYAFVNKVAYFTQYPIDSETLAKPATDIYTALFDAINKGLIYLDITPDPKLLTVDNPYSSAVWNQYGISVLWDHAYYNGHYYSYYGILPVLLVSFPMYYLSGCTLVPNLIFLQTFAVLLFIPCFLVLLLEINKLITKKVSWPLLIFLMVISLCTAMTYANVTFKDGYYHEGVYHTPIAYGLVCTCLFLIFAIRSYRVEGHKTINLFLSGLFFVFIIASRPNMAMSLLIVLPLFLAVLFKKGVSAKTKALEFAPMATILAIGAVLICSYNYARYGNIVEFGQKYQMNYDQTELNYEFNKILPSIVHFYFQGPTFYNVFPFLSCSNLTLSFDNAIYIRSYLGSVWVPFFWFAIPLPFLFKKKDGLPIRIFAITLPLTIFFYAFTTYSLAGLCPRYLIEFYFLSTLAAFAGVIKLFDMYKGTQTMKSLVPLTALLCCLGAVITIGLQFDSFDGMISGDWNGILLTLREAFSNFNV